MVFVRIELRQLYLLRIDFFVYHLIQVRLGVLSRRMCCLVWVLMSCDEVTGLGCSWDGTGVS
jgi:hypothetical protein